MKKNSFLVQSTAYVCLALSLQLVSCSDDSKPSDTDQITTIDPATGYAGTLVTITGKGFGATEADNMVKFNGKVAVIQLASTTGIAATVPTDAGTGPVTVTVGSKVITGPVFTYTEPKATKTYYYSFKADGVTKVFEESNPGYSACGECSCSDLPVLSDAYYAGLDICQSTAVTPTMIQNLKSKTIPFKHGGSYPVANFGYTEKSISYTTDNVDQGTFSAQVTDVTAEADYLGYKVYRVTGTFECKVATTGGAPISITEGKFIIRYTQDY